MGERLTWQRGREEAPKSSIPSKFESGDKVEKIGFLYDQQQTDRESYLTGKKVDKAFDDYLDREKRNFENSLNPHKESEKDREIDVSYKAKEDPLNFLKEKEHEKFKQLQANPQKMARLQKLMKAYLGNQNDSDSSEDEKTVSKKSKKSSRRRSRSRSRDRRRNEKRSRSRERKRSRDRKRSSSRDRSKKSRPRSTSRSKSPAPKETKYKGYGLIKKGNDSEEKLSTSSEKYESKFKSQYKPHAYQRKLQQGFSNKLSAEEKQRKIDEMMGNASKNDVERASRVKKGRQIEDKEEKDFEANRNDHSYYRDLKMKATEKSLEERVRARRDRNQKTSAALDKNWTKR